MLDALSARAEELSASGSLSIHVDRIDDLGLTPPAEAALYRIVTEAFNNVVRHAHATRCEIRFTTTPNHLMVEISDDGSGGDPDETDRHGVGLSSMAARANEVGGFVTARPLPDRGFRVTVTLPRTQLVHPTRVPSVPSAPSESRLRSDGRSTELSAEVANEDSDRCPSRW